MSRSNPKPTSNVPAIFPEALVANRMSLVHAQGPDVNAGLNLPDSDPFPELGESVIDDIQYAANKASHALDREFDATFDRLLNAQNALSEEEQLAFAPLLADHLRRNAKASVEAEVLTVETAAEYFRTAAELLEQVGKRKLA